MRLPFKPLLIAAPLLAAPLLAGCHGHVDTDGPNGNKIEFTMKGGSLTLRKRIVIVKVSGHDTAYVTTHGHLVIGNSNADEVPTNDDQRAALVAYNKAANGMIDKGIDVGVEGAHVAANAIGIVIKDAVNGNTQDIDKDVKKGVEPIKSKVDDLCDQLDTWRQRQNDVAKLIPAFEPYVIIGDADIKDCHDHGFKDDDDDKSVGDYDKDDDKDADKSADDDDGKDTSDKPADAAKDADKQPPAPPAPAVTPPSEPGAPKAPDASSAPHSKGNTGGGTKKSLTV